MKKTLLFSALALLLAGLNSCGSDGKDSISDNGLSQEVKEQIAALGFSSEGAFETDGGYIVEGDIFLTEEDLHGHGPGETHNLVVGNAEQYRTTNLVTGLPRVITVTTSGSNITSGLSSAIDAAIARYNAENLGLTFARGGSSGGGDINIRVVNTGQYIASAGFPSGGNPHDEILYAKKYNNYSAGFMTTVIAHEMGHCIGFRHTDYMNRAYSCGSGGNEGASTVGAVHIPGTPTGPDAGSWMLACLGATTNRPFNANDVIALNFLYD
ncbi:MAG: protease [Saprospiraceae bacterium]|nr:protease [Saprospiraceae bacterium]